METTLRSIQDDLILSHLWTVKSVAHSLKTTRLFSADWDELISAGNLALVKAARGFKGRNGCQFKTYAFKFIRGEMFKSFTRIDGHHDSGMIEFTPLTDFAVDASQEQQIYREERVTILDALMANLKPQHREVIGAYLSGQSLVQLARNKGMKRDRIMKWQRTGIKNLIAAGVPFRA